jgi:hypothetical protein
MIIFYLSVGHEYDTPVSLGSANVGETNTGVTCSTLNDSSARFYAVHILNP